MPYLHPQKCQRSLWTNPCGSKVTHESFDSHLLIIVKYDMRIMTHRASNVIKISGGRFITTISQNGWTTNATESLPATMSKQSNLNAYHVTLMHCSVTAFETVSVDDGRSRHAMPCQQPTTVYNAALPCPVCVFVWLGTNGNTQVSACKISSKPLRFVEHTRMATARRWRWQRWFWWWCWWWSWVLVVPASSSGDACWTGTAQQELPECLVGRKSL